MADAVDSGDSGDSDEGIDSGRVCASPPRWTSPGAGALGVSPSPTVADACDLFNGFQVTCSDCGDGSMSCLDFLVANAIAYGVPNVGGAVFAEVDEVEASNNCRP